MPRGIVARALRPPAVRERRHAAVELLTGLDHYERLIVELLPSARVAVWIATANLKDLRVEAPIGTRARARGQYVSVLDTLRELSQRGVEIRILHGRPPSGPFQQSFLARKRGLGKLELKECPRVHMKVVTVDGRELYMGSANFTGAGLGARAAERRNFELGILSDDEVLLDRVQGQFDAIWSGRECKSCKLRSKCPAPLDNPR